MKYYNNLKLKVSPVLKSYKSDLEIHDKKALTGYTGRFLHGARESGTDIFLLDYWKEELSKVIKKEKTNFTAKGYFNLKSISPKEFIENGYPCYALINRDTNNLFHYGNNGRIKRITHDQLIDILNKFYIELIPIFQEIQSDQIYLAKMHEQKLKEEEKERLSK